MGIVFAALVFSAAIVAALIGLRRRRSREGSNLPLKQPLLQEQHAVEMVPVQTQPDDAGSQPQAELECVTTEQQHKAVEEAQLERLRGMYCTLCQQPLGAMSAMHSSMFFMDEPASTEVQSVALRLCGGCSVGHCPTCGEQLSLHSHTSANDSNINRAMGGSLRVCASCGYQDGAAGMDNNDQKQTRKSKPKPAAGLTFDDDAGK